MKTLLDELKKYKNEKKTFFITLFTALIVHFQLYALIITAPDALINSMYHKASGEATLRKIWFILCANGKRKCRISCFCKHI